MTASAQKKDIVEAEANTAASEAANVARAEVLEQAKEAVITRQEADVIVLGCTGMLGVAKDLQAALLDAANVHVPVVDPTAAAITWLESAHRMGLRPSRTTYMPPRNPH